MEKKTAFKTDLNERERKRFTKQMRDIAKLANETADGLETGNDKNFIMSFLAYSIHNIGLNELRDIAMEASVNSPKTEKPADFPDIIE